jgi:[acyl-carrier-protein] S-malonyltransferase
MTSRSTSGPAPSVAFVFSGQGAQYIAMTSRLFLESRAYSAHLEAVSSVLRPCLDASIVDLIVRGDERLCEAGLAEPALFAVQYALVRTLAELGLRPAAVLGQGIGEFAAAAAIGAVSVQDAAYLAAAFGALAAAAHADAADADSRARPGPNAAASESEPGDPAALGRFAAAVRALPSAAPRVPYYSSARGRRLSGELLDPDYWVEQAGAAPHFESALADLLSFEAPDAVVEIGPRPVLAAVVRRLAGTRGPACVSACSGTDTPAAALEGLAERIGLACAVDDPVTCLVLEAVAEVMEAPPLPLGVDLALRTDLGFDSLMLMQLKFIIEQRMPEVGRFTMRDILDHLSTPRGMADFLRTQQFASSNAR